MITIDFTTKPKKTIPQYEENEERWKHLYDNCGELHSFNDLPASISPRGSQFWYSHGRRHRDNDLPAIVFPDGKKQYWVNGKRIK